MAMENVLELQNCLYIHGDVKKSIKALKIVQALLIPVQDVYYFRQLNLNNLEINDMNDDNMTSLFTIKELHENLPTILFHFCSSTYKILCQIISMKLQPLLAVEQIKFSKFLHPITLNSLQKIQLQLKCQNVLVVWCHCTFHWEKEIIHP